MKYIVLDTQRALALGFNPGLYRRSKKGIRVIINENDLKHNPKIPGETIEDKALFVNGKIYDKNEIHNLMKGNW